MSLMTETQAAVSLDSLPRVNLLPPEIAETARMRRIQMGLGCAVLGTVTAVALTRPVTFRTVSPMYTSPASPGGTHRRSSSRR